MTKLEEVLSFGTNLSFHVFILLTFLSILFFTYISKLTTQHIQHEVDVLVKKEMTDLLVSVDKKDQWHAIDWSFVAKSTSVLKKNYENELPSVKKHNTRLRHNVVYFLIGYVVVLLVVIMYTTFKGIHLGVKYILIENLIIFTFVGFVELYFFQNIASKYIPVTPDTAANTVIQRVKENVSKTH